MDFVRDILMGQIGAGAFYSAGLGLALMIGLGAANLLFGLSAIVRRIWQTTAIMLMAPVLIWMFLFYADILVNGNFEGHWFAFALCAAMTAFQLWMCILPILGIRRLLHGIRA